MNAFNLLQALVLSVGLVAHTMAQTGAPADPASALFTADSTLGAAAHARSAHDALAAMLAADAVMPDPARSGFAEGRAAVLEAVLRDTLFRDGRLSWQPVRAGISADGRHGLTIGVMQLTTARGQTRRFKYLAYWVRGAEGWQARVWRRVPVTASVTTPVTTPAATPAAAPAAEGSVATGASAPWLPRSTALALEGESLQRAQAELAGMEQRFSDSASEVGIGPAFLAFGADDAWHVGSPTDAGFTRGNAAIARAVQGDAPAGTSPVTWSADRALVAASGDLGVTLGYIVPVTARPDGSRPRFPFFTIWRREASGWKYIAE